MDSARRQRDKAYRHLFKGSVLVSTLLDQDKERFGSRKDAIGFGQRLLDEGHIQSIVGSSDFDDSVHLYRWSDESVVQEAKKLVSTTSSHIPKKRLIELLDFQDEHSTEDNGFDMQGVQRAFQCNGTDDELELSRDRPASPCLSTTGSETGSRVTKRIKTRPSGIPRPRVAPCNKDGASPERRYSSDALGSSETTDKVPSIDKVSRTNTCSKPSKLPERHCVQKSPQHTRVDLISTTPQRQPQHTKLDFVTAKPPRAPQNTNIELTPPRSPQHSKLDFSPQKPPQHTIVNLVTEKVKRSPQHASVDFVAFADFQMSPPVSPLQNKDFYENSIAPDMTSSPEQPARDEPQGSDASCDRGAASDVDMISTCRYDGVDMLALDLENLDFDVLRPSTEKMVNDSLEAMQKSLDSMQEQRHGFSDNEKQLLEQMKLMQTEHQTMISSYEEKLDSLIKSVADIKSVTSQSAKSCNHGDTESEEEEKGESSLQSKTDAQKKADQEEKERSTLDSSKQVAESVPQSPPSTIPVPPSPEAISCGTPGPPPPPPPPPMTSQAPRVLKPSKLPRKPSIKMRPLFWNRIILDTNAKDEASFWHSATEPNFDVEDFETLFGKKKESSSSEKASLHEALSPSRGRTKSQSAKLLEERRSRAVGIKMRSLHCNLEDIKHAVYKLDFSKVEVDSLQSLSEMRATEEELDKIQQQLKENPGVPLDKPEEFLWELSRLSYFTERMKCLVLRKRFNETLFNIDQQLCTVQNACTELMKSDGVRNVMEMVLALGNYMNGGTQRGQADGFDLSILSKINDVKAMDNSMTLLNYIVRQHCREHEEHVGKKEAEFPLPEQSIMTSAAATSFPELAKELDQLKHELELYGKKAEEIYLNSEPGTQHPFKEQMDDFFDSAEHMLRSQKVKVDETQEEFKTLHSFFVLKSKNEITTDVYFAIWATFLEEYRRCWKAEQRRIARLMFEKVEQKRKERMLKMKRRASVAVTDDNNNTNGANLKQKFKALRRRSEQVHTVKLLRSQSVNNMIEPDDEDSADSRATKSFSAYPSSNASTPSPTPLKPSEILRHRFSGNYLTSPTRDQDQDNVFNHLQDGRRRVSREEKKDDQSKLVSTYQLNLKKELKPTITVTNPITNVPEEVTLRRDLNNISPQLSEGHPMHERIRKRRSRVFADDDTPEYQSSALEDSNNQAATEIKLERPRRERPPTRPKSFMNLDEYSRNANRTSSPLSALKSPKGPVKIDYNTDYVPGTPDRTDNYVSHTTPPSSCDLSVMRSTENLTQEEESQSQSSPFPSSTSSVSPLSSPSPSTPFQTPTAPISLYNSSPHRCSSVERLFTSSNSLQLAASRSRREREPLGEDVAPSEREYSEALRKLSRARAQSVGAAR